MNEIQRMRTEHLEDGKKGAAHDKKNPRTHLPEKMTDADRAMYQRAISAKFPADGSAGDGGKALDAFDHQTDGAYRVDSQEDEDAPKLSSVKTSETPKL